MGDRLAAAMPLCYLQIRDNATLEVCPSLRDWNDYDIDRHLEYHVAMIECMGDRFSVVVDPRQGCLFVTHKKGAFTSRSWCDASGDAWRCTEWCCQCEGGSTVG